MATQQQKRDFGIALRAARTAKKWTQRQVSKMLEAEGFEVSTANLSLYEKGQSAPRDPDVVRSLEKVLGLRSELTTALGLAVDFDQIASDAIFRADLGLIDIVAAGGGPLEVDDVRHIRSSGLSDHLLVAMMETMKALANRVGETEARLGVLWDREVQSQRHLRAAETGKPTPKGPKRSRPEPDPEPD